MEKKFRAWDMQAKVMVYGVALYFPPDHIGFSYEVFEQYYKHIEEQDHLEFDHHWVWILSNFEVMQYVGLKDKKGKEIYEGDILIGEGMIGKVYYAVQDACFDIDWDKNKIATFRYSHEYEVVGNVYENPGMLEKK